MKYDLVIFDLDGTLLDTLDDLAAAVNHAMRTQGFPLREREEVRRLVGNGIASTIRRAVPEGTDEPAILRALSDFKNYYLQNVDVYTRPYDGVPELLDALNAAGVRAAVNSNKVDSVVNALCDAHVPGRFAYVLGEREGIPKKPAPDGVNMILDALDIRRERALYVGDGEADLRTALNAGIDCAWVSWGFRKPEELEGLVIPRRFDSAEALGRFLLE